MSIQRDIDAELRFHFDARIEELVAQGQTPEAARAQAVAEFGDVDDTRASLRDIDRRVAKRRHRAETLDAIWQDLRYAVRSLRRSPTVSLTIIITLALGIGVNAAMFSLLDTIYLRPPAGVADPRALRRIWVEQHFRNGARYWPGFSYISLAPIAQTLDGQADVTLYRQPQKYRLGRGEFAPFVRVSGTMANFFPTFGVRAARGRLYSEAEGAVANAAPVAVISDAFWRRQFNGDASVLGQTLQLATQKFTIIGVTPPGFRGIDLEAADVWIPLGALVPAPRPGRSPWWQSPNVNGFQLVLRLRPDAREGELVHRVTQAVRQPGSTYFNDTLSVAAFGAINAERGPGKVSMEMQVATRLAGVAILVLLIACANVVNLLLARAVNRRREIAVRLALGISRARLIRFLVTESVVLAIAAATAALIAANFGGALLRTLLMPNVEWASEVLDWRVLMFALTAAVVAGALAGLVPALQAASPRLTEGLRAGAREGGVHRSRLRATLVVAQAALSVVLLVGAVLFVRSLQNVKAHDVGYTVDRLAFVEAAYDTRDSVRDAAYPKQLTALEQSLARIPGVENVALTSMRPMSGFSTVSYFPDADTVNHTKPMLLFTAVSPSFFATTGMKVLRGRTFANDGSARSALSAVVNEELARTLWPNEDPIGRCIRIETPTAQCATIIGVTQTAIMGSLAEKPYAQMYVALDGPAARGYHAATAIVRVAPERSAAAQQSVRELIRASFPGSIPRLSTMGAEMAVEYRPWDLGARLFTVFGVLALVVAAIGVYSTVSYAVNQRTHEFGVRIALGARAADVLRQVLGEGLRTIAIGIVTGVLLALAAGRLVAALLYGIAPSDPSSLAIVATILVVIALVAAIAPAWRASRADPVSALRAD